MESLGWKVARAVRIAARGIAGALAQLAQTARDRWAVPRIYTSANNDLSIREARELSKLSTSVPSRWLVHYWPQANRLGDLFALYGTAKQSSAGAPYNELYFDLLEGRSDRISAVFECGIGSTNPTIAYTMAAHVKPGASLRAGRDFFPNAMTYGADIDRDVLFQDKRIKTSWIDQVDPSAVAAYWKEVGEPAVDVMFDDGCHEYEAHRCLLEGSFGFLKPSGLYIIEDVMPSTLVKLSSYLRNAGYDFKTFSLATRTKLPLLGPNDVKLGASSIVVIRKAAESRSRSKDD